MMAFIWDWWQLETIWNHLTIILMAFITMFTRSFFFIPDREIRWPSWASRGLQFAPIAAVSAVIVPEIIMINGVLISTLKDARIYGALAGLAYFVIRRGKGQVVMGTMLFGMAVFLPLRLGLGW